MNAKKKIKTICKKINFLLFKRSHGLIGFHIMALLRIIRFMPVYRNFRHIPKMKNSHKGERCFVMATGPSLALEDCELLEEEITFGVNGIFRLFDKTQWRPTYYMLIDLKEYRSYRSKGSQMDFDKYCKEGAFLSEDVYNYSNAKENSLKAFPFPIFFTGGWLERGFLKDFIYSKNMLWGFYSSWTVITFAITLAQYMGFKEIYLVGTDCDYSNKKKYFDDVKNIRHKNVFDEQLAQKRMVDAYSFIKKHLSSEVFNATRGGALEVFPRVRLEDVINKKSNKICEVQDNENSGRNPSKV